MKISRIFKSLGVIRSLMVFFLLPGMLAILTPQAGADLKVDNRLYAELLGKHTRDGLVDYASFKSSRLNLSGLIPAR